MDEKPSSIELGLKHELTVLVRRGPYGSPDAFGVGVLKREFVALFEEFLKTRQESFD